MLLKHCLGDGLVKAASSNRVQHPPEDHQSQSILIATTKFSQDYDIQQRFPHGATSNLALLYFHHAKFQKLVYGQKNK